MYPAEKHYAVYAQTKSGIVIITILHSKRDIEAIIREIYDGVAAEILSVLKWKFQPALAGIRIQSIPVKPIDDRRPWER